MGGDRKRREWEVLDDRVVQLLRRVAGVGSVAEGCGRAYSLAADRCMLSPVTLSCSQMLTLCALMILTDWSRAYSLHAVSCKGIFP